MEQMWMVRAGKNAAHVDDFLAEGVIAIGWAGATALDPGASREEVFDQMRAASPAHSPQKVASAAGQVFRFLSEISAGDRVCTYDPGRRRYCLGVVGEEVGVRDHVLGRYRRVSWTKHVGRDVLSTGARNSLGAIMTLFRVPDAVAEELERKSLPLESDLGSGAATAQSQSPQTQDESVDVDENGAAGFGEIASRASELIEDAITTLDWEDMQELVAGILRAMGYRTQVSPRGADRGVDIAASPDGLLLEEPRIFVEVKHRPGSSMGSGQLRSFLGGRQAGDRCLYVSTGGFTKDAKYEAERSAIPITLIDLPRLRELLLENYDKLDAQSVALVALGRVYWPVE